jgi:exonuclease III
MSLSLITVNVGAPSVERARRQLEWLAERPDDISVLTETKATPGSQLLADACTAANYSVTFPEHDPGELGIMIVSKVATTPDPLIGALSYLPARATGVIVSTSDGPLRVLGAYVPSRDATLERTERKKRWIEGFHTALDATQSGVPMLLLGDLNVLDSVTSLNTASSSRHSSTTSTGPSPPGTASSTRSGICTPVSSSTAGRDGPTSATATTTPTALRSFCLCSKAVSTSTRPGTFSRTDRG